MLNRNILSRKGFGLGHSMWNLIQSLIEILYLIAMVDIYKVKSKQKYFYIKINNN